MSSEEIRGPIFGWRFPFLNRLLALLNSRRHGKGALPNPVQAALPSPMGVARAHNLEIWEWTDYKGQDRKITVHREVEQTG